MGADEPLVLAANQAFYDAFARGDLDALEGLLAERAPVACIHPGWDALHGRDEVIASLRAILAGSGAPSIACVDPVAHVLGDAAYVICGESLDGSYLIATNLFVREDGEWKLCHHQAGPVSRPRSEARARPKPKPGLLN
jgi:ketosteroid isomerase-like protein